MRVLLLLLALAGAAHAQNSGCSPGQNTCYPCPSRSFVPQSFLQYPCTVTAASDISLGSMRLLCGAFTLGCAASVSQLAWELSANEAGKSYAVGIYQFNRTTLTGTRIMDSGILDAGAAAPQIKTATVAGTLDGSQEYLACVATDSAAGTIRMAACNYTLAQSAGGISYFIGNAAVGNLGQFNTACTDTITPYACCQKGICAGGSNDGTHCDDDTVCTGGGTCSATAGTGICTGLPTSTGVMAVSGLPAPLVALVR